MEFSKNDTLITNICQVQIKSVVDVVDLPSFEDFYSTPSKISMSVRSQVTQNGALHTKNLALRFPGLSISDFQTFSNLIKGQYRVLIKLDTNDIYEITSKRYPMDCTTSFSQGHTVNFTSQSPISVTFIENQANTGIESDGFNYDFNFYVS